MGCSLCVATEQYTKGINNTKIIYFRPLGLVAFPALLMNASERCPPKGATKCCAGSLKLCSLGFKNHPPAFNYALVLCAGGCLALGVEAGLLVPLANNHT